ncbi:MAG: tetratricopeptide repeat protein [Dongiaceae bacterium]
MSFHSVQLGTLDKYVWVVALLIAIGFFAIGKPWQYFIGDPTANIIFKGDGAMQRGDFTEAAAIFAEAAAKQPRNPEFRARLGLAYGALKRWPDALAQYQYALSLDGNNLTAHRGMGLYALELRQLPQAEEWRKRLASLCPQGCPDLTALTAEISKARLRR